MAPADVKIQTIQVGLYDSEEGEKSISTRKFITKNEKIIFDGFLKVYNPTNKAEGEEDSDDETSKKQVSVNEGDYLELKKLNSAQKYTKPPMEDLLRQVL